MRIDSVHALELVGRLRHELVQIPREGETWRPLPVSVLDTIRAVRALRPLVLECEQLRSQLGASFTRPLSFAEQELRRVLTDAIDTADREGVRTLLLPGQDDDERRMLGVSS